MMMFLLLTEKAGAGLGVLSAAVLLAGEMAGSGVLALPNAMIGTGGIFGIVLIIGFTVNALYSGTRLGLCWVMLEERYEEFRGEVRDPYPAIAHKAVGAWARYLGGVSGVMNMFCCRIVSVVSITLTLYGGGCVFIVLISQLLSSLCEAAGFHLSLCVWMVIVAGGLTPLTWMGTPKDFWPIAVGALISTIIACLLIVINCILLGAEKTERPVYPAPSPMGFFKGKLKVKLKKLKGIFQRSAQ